MGIKPMRIKRKPLRLPRRALLRGLGGAAVALPFLEAMLPTRALAASGGSPRYVAMFAGVEQLHCIPSSAGAGYSMPAGLASLESVRDHISIVSGLGLEGTGPSGVTPPGGKANPHHGNIMKPLLTGIRSTSDEKFPVTATADQLIADVVGADTHFRSLEYRAQPSGYRGGINFLNGGMSYEAGGVPREPQKSPQLAYESMFAGFTPTDSADVAAKQALLERRLSVLDLVSERGDDLVARVSTYDRRRLEQHFDQIRDLETRLSEIPDTSGEGCSQFPDPGSDPAEEDYANTEHGGTAGYSGEEERAAIFVDLIHMALVCDLTRVATLVITAEQSMMSIQPLFGAAYEMHDVTHNDIPNRNEVWNDITSWHAGFFASLVQKLADTPDATGGTLLDDTIVLMMNSGGPSGHGGTNMAFPIAGCPSVLRIGEHVLAPSGSHPSRLFQTALHAVGIDQDFGELPGLVDGLLL